MFRFITLALSKPQKPRDPHASYNPEAIRGIVSSRSHGNVRLQSGKFYTKNDVDEQYERVRKFNFAK